ncbi:hypothetical protein TWF718_007201 [Orbilia javanica]|uniref:Uncharacterized protein n=1 Tax=Orbilia javanica TaxID=47235 RepID=A0AAN8MYG6_9PEZI
MSSHPHPPPTAPPPHGNRGGHGGGRGQGQGQGQSHGRSRGRGRGRGGGPQYPRPGPSAFSATNGSNTVPRHSVIHTNTPVSIILKEDQPTGRQVTGLVADVLTRGDHHRGVKVRLKDGRVGRVQRVLEGGVSESSGGGQAVGGAPSGAVATEGGSSGFQDSNWGGRGGRGGNRGDYRGDYRGGRGRGRGRGGFRPYSTSSPRGEDGNERSEATYDLTAFVRGGGRGGGRGGRNGYWRGGRGAGNINTGGFSGYGEEIQLSPLGSEEFLENGPKEDPVVRCPVCGDFEGDETAVSHHVEAHFT